MLGLANKPTTLAAVRRRNKEIAPCSLPFLAHTQLRQHLLEQQAELDRLELDADASEPGLQFVLLLRRKSLWCAIAETGERKSFTVDGRLKGGTKHRNFEADRKPARMREVAPARDTARHQLIADRQQR